MKLIEKGATVGPKWTVIPVKFGGPGSIEREFARRRTFTAVKRTVEKYDSGWSENAKQDS